MNYKVYEVLTTFGKFRFAACLVEAAAPIHSIDDAAEDPLNVQTWSSTPYQTADARHDADKAAILLLEYYGQLYWLDPDVEVDDEGDEPTYDGATRADYLKGLIRHVEPIEGTPHDSLLED